MLISYHCRKKEDLKDKNLIGDFNFKDASTLTVAFWKTLFILLPIATYKCKCIDPSHPRVCFQTTHALTPFTAIGRKLPLQIILQFYNIMLSSKLFYFTTNNFFLKKSCNIYQIIKKIEFNI